MASSNRFGPLVGPWDIEQAVIQTIESWLDSYLTEIERDHSLTPRFYDRPPTGSIYGGVDMDTWEEENAPVVIVNAKPLGTPEKYGSAGHVVWFDVQVGSIVIRGEADGSEEHEARQMAGFYATAIMGLILQQPVGVGLISDKELNSAPTVEFYDPAIRRVAKGLVGFRLMAGPIVDQRTGPTSQDPSPPTDPPDPTQLPTVTHEPVVTVTGEAL